MSYEPVPTIGYKSSYRWILRLARVELYGCLPGYNQIRMDPLDTPKIAFMLNHKNYYYNVMPIDLYKVGATYQ